MSSIKEICKSSMNKLSNAAKQCDEFVQGLIPKLHCVPAAKEAVAACKQMIGNCRHHLKACKNGACVNACNALIKASEKAIEKNTACIDACTGSSSDADCKTVCKDAANASRACLKSCQDCMSQACA